MKKRLILAVDGGGTNTRLCLVTSDGMMVHHISIVGGTHPGKNSDPKGNIERGLDLVLQGTSYQMEEIDQVVAGIAGYNSEEDREWVDDLFDFPSLSCSKILVNDAIIAYESVFMGQAGLLTISGTGSNMIIQHEQGEYLFAKDLGFYAKCASRHLTENMLEVFFSNRRITPVDQELFNILDKKARAVEMSLLQLTKQPESRVRNKLFSELAPFVTEYARKESPIANQACMMVAQAIAEGIQLFSPYFQQPFPISIVGSVGQDALIQTYLILQLQREGITHPIIPACQPPVVGAAMIGLRHLQCWNEEIRDRLRSSFSV
ncbi:BadF/BadG/BcrA/BcrD ATPase family protein [Risungbinella massiliensis]|uniref:BadF/BadG/BcrA/BcrD ATPase family protein n=1 Tax=Risungbinella massiliensis TaxID=1329796 RepID=UPI0005CB8EA7|nr:BadF/BadG/BcrA/BcrD ATPase family protein [Risungbinella massiliensis]